MLHQHALESHLSRVIYGTVSLGIIKIYKNVYEQKMG